MNHKLFLREVALSAAEPTRLNVLAHLREIEVIVIVNVNCQLSISLLNSKFLQTWQ